MPLIDLDAAIAALQSESQSNNPYISGLAMRMADRLRALPTVQPDPLGVVPLAVSQEWLRERITDDVNFEVDTGKFNPPTTDAELIKRLLTGSPSAFDCLIAAGRIDILTAAPTPEQLLADAAETLFDMLHKRGELWKSLDRDFVQTLWDDVKREVGYVAVSAFLTALAKLRGGA